MIDLEVLGCAGYVEVAGDLDIAVEFSGESIAHRTAAAGSGDAMTANLGVAVAAERGYSVPARLIFALSSARKYAKAADAAGAHPANPAQSITAFTGVTFAAGGLHARPALVVARSSGGLHSRGAVETAESSLGFHADAGRAHGGACVTTVGANARAGLATGTRAPAGGVHTRAAGAR